MGKYPNHMKIAVAGTGYVGLSIATLLAQHNEVVAVDVVPEKVDKINNRQSPIQDEYIERYLAEKDLNLTATLDGEKAYSEAEFVVVATPTNYDPVTNYFDTTLVERRFQLATPSQFVRRPAPKISCSPRSSFVRPRLCTTTFIPAASSSAVLRATSALTRLRIVSPSSCRKAHSSPMSIPCLWA